MLDRFAASCVAKGFAVIHPFDASWWDGAPALPAVGRLGIVVGNTRSLWPHVQSACRGGEQDPVDRYAERAITAAAENAFERAHDIVWAHHVDPPFPVQRLAEAVGLATLSPSHLAIHPDHGPWWALRAVVVVDAEPPVSRRRVDLCSPCDKPCMRPFAHAQNSGDWRAWLAVRDACPVGHASRYSDEQVLYHYENAFLSRS